MFLLSIRRALAFQIALIGLVVLALGFWKGVEVAVATGYGTLAALLNSALLYWRWSSGATRFHSDVHRHLQSFFRSSLERFIVVGLWLAMGFAWVRLPPWAMLTGFVVGQLAWLAATLALRERS
jgi:ATP synthase protein I